ncbi:MAG TPA: glycine/sarcosine/betaine reductase component B subunit [bacterium]|nr:glycine/sarcosine/betaine reductase component B subunit [bacterium]
MELKMGTFPVKRLIFADRTSYTNGLLQINKQELIAEARKDPLVKKADIQLAMPGEPVRIWPVRDVIEPRVKVRGSGQCYPAICGRSIEPIGEGITHRLSGIGVVEVSNVPWHDAGGDYVDVFVDMCGPWARAIPHLSSLKNICVIVEPDETIDVHDQNQVVHGACLRVSDHIAATTMDLVPAKYKTYRISNYDPDLPTVMYIQCLHSPEGKSGSTKAFCTSIYGYTELQPPWYLHPNEILDGAITGPYRTVFNVSWTLQNNPLLLELYRRHGNDFNFKGVITLRTEWTSQKEKKIIADQTAKMAKAMGANGVVMTWDAGGNEFMEVLRTLQACERLGIKTVLIAAEDTPSDNLFPLLEPAEEADALISPGFVYSQDMNIGTLPIVDEVIGNSERFQGHWDLKQETVATSSNNLILPRWYNDHLGMMKYSCDDY